MLSSGALRSQQLLERLAVADPSLALVIYRVRYLSNPQHKFKVRRNAEQSNLTGCCIFNPKFCLVYVEGSAKAVKFFKRVMLVRVDWTETARPLPGEEALLPPAKVEFEQEENMAENRCDLMWEGPIKEKTFNRFMPKNTESERAVRDFLGEKNQGYWDVSFPHTLFVPLATRRLLTIDPFCAFRSLLALCLTTTRSTRPQSRSDHMTIVISYSLLCDDPRKFLARWASTKLSKRQQPSGRREIVGTARHERGVRANVSYQRHFGGGYTEAGTKEGEQKTKGQERRCVCVRSKTKESVDDVKDT